MSLKRVTIQSGSLQLTARLRETETATRIWAALPITGMVTRWGESVSFQVDVEAPVEADAQQVWAPGICCFWSEGQVITLPFGPTPISLAEESKLIAPANAWAEFEGSISALEQVQEGDPVTVSRHP